MDAFPTALDVAALIRTRQASPVEVLEESLARVDRLNPSLNAVIWRDDEAARAAAKEAADVVATTPVDESPPFLGVPLPIKDLSPAAGQPRTYGSFRASDEPQTEDELVVGAFRRAGFVLTGRTNTPELGPITAAENDRYGVTRNPWNIAHTPGGSSGGAAAAVASGMFSVAHGNDGGGSIRIPASCCGLVGLKVSRGRVPALIETFEGGAVEGAVTHTVADTAAVLDVICGPDPLAWYNAPAPQQSFVNEVGADPGRLRVGLMDTAPFDITMAESCRDAVRQAALVLEGLGHVVEQATIDVDPEALAPFLALVDGSYTQAITDWSSVEPHNRIGHQRGLERSSVDYVQSVNILRRWSRQFVSHWGRDFDVLLTPTMSIEPPLAGEILAEVKADPADTSPTVFATAVLAAPFNITGLPAISLPLHQSPSGLPIGVQLVERPFNEAGLLRLAAQLEAAAPWRDRHPPM